MLIKDFEASNLKERVDDIAINDIILINEPVFDKYDPVRKTAKILGYRKILAKVIKDNYGSVSGQHTFTLQVLDSEGYNAPKKDEIIKRKGRNLYKPENKMIRYSTLEQREEKHQRGKEAREKKYWQFIIEIENENKINKIEKIPRDFLEKNKEEIKKYFPKTFKIISSLFNI